ncbi:MAG TPA: BlaI/MecI/CopY family transcriptional regulator, partial [Calditrichia bacterium]|nr:BlaI/MecI/CopY family transcriptional regulator [Calditrichia bacterium]
LLERETFHGVFVYRALVSRPAGLVRFIQFFAERVLETDPATVVTLFAKNETLSEAEIAELNRLLEEGEADEEEGA